MFGTKLTTKLAMFFAIAAIVCLPALSQSTAPTSTPAPGHIHTTAVPTARVIAKVDNSLRTTLPGHLPGALSTAQDMGRVAPTTSAQHLVMVLKSSDQQKTELRRILDEQQDSNSSNYHQWITPDQFGATFGVADSDIAQVSAWLQSQGFSVESVSKSKRVLYFSGTTGNLETAFKTEIHTFQANGETHVSNNSVISVPKALAPVIAGVTMDNFFRKPAMGPTTVISGPELTNGSNHYVGPADFATIYNTTPLLAAGINGSGVSIAVAGRTDILLSDVQTYRQLFNLPNNDPIFIHAGQDNGTEPGDDGESDLDVEISGGIAPKAQVYFVIGTPTYFVDGITNSVQYIVENNLADIMSISYGLCEASLGSGGNEFNNQAYEQAAAQGISVFVSSGDNGPASCDSSNNSYEVYGYAVSGDASTPYNVAVGGSEFYENGVTSYWGTQNPLTLGSAASYIPETPWNEARGADKTSTTGGLSGLWSSSGGISAYYLKPAWQHGPGVPTLDPDLTQAQYGGQWVSSYTITNGGSGYTAAPTVSFSGGGCTQQATATAVLTAGAVTSLGFNYLGIGCTSAPTITFSAAPVGGTTATATATIGPMQTPTPLITGVPHRYVPDLSLNAASGHDATVFCSEGVCKISSTGTWQGLGLVGGTSVAAPSMAGLQALIDQANGGRQGAPNYIYYTLAAAENTTGCNSFLPPAAGSNCAFQDITVGDNLVCGTSTCSATTGTKIGFQAGAGYDMATGLGSVNAANLSSQWSSVKFNSSNTTLNLPPGVALLSQTTGIPQGTSITLSGTVASGSSSGTPTGDVAFILSQGEFGNTVDITTGAWSTPGPYTTLDSSGNYSATLSNLPGGTYTLTARYAGDENFGSSLSAPVPITVLQGNSVITGTAAYIDNNCNYTTPPSFTYGQFIWWPVNVASSTPGANGSSVPTGTVAFTIDGNPYGTETLDPQGNGYLAAGTIGTTVSSCLYDYIFAQSPTLIAGPHTFGVTYSGDSTFSPATGFATFFVNQLASTPTLSIGATNITTGASVPMVATFTAPTLKGITTTNSGPTGTVTFFDTTTASSVGSASLVPTVSFSGNTFTYGATASLTTTSITTSGVNSIVAQYSGDINYLAETSAAVNVNVGAGAPSSVALLSSANPTTLNGRPTFTATVTPAAATGTVTFYDGANQLGTGTLTAGIASFRPASGTAFFAGTHSIVAYYGGDATYASSNSAVYPEVVNQGTTTIALTAKTVGTLTQTYTFAAVITPSQTNGTFAPNQSQVKFFDGATQIGSATPMTITSGQGGYGIWTATMSTSSLAFGNHTITAQYSDVNYSLSTSNAQTVFVGGTPTVTWATPAAITYPAPLTTAQLNATANIPGTFTYTPALGTVLNAGNQTLSVTFTPADSTDFAPQTKTVTLPVLQIAQTISFTLASPVTYSPGLTIPLVATGGASGNPVVFSVLSGPGSVSGPNGSILTVTGGGTIVVAANQAGNINYSAATEVTQALIVNGASQAITFALNSPVTYTSSPLLVIQLLAKDSTTPNSGNPITFSVASGPGTISGSALTVTGIGTIVVNADQAGNASYTAATTVSQSLVVNPAAQVITFDPIAPVVYGLPPFQLAATGGASGNPVTFSVLSGPGSVTTSGMLTVTGAGTIIIAADQAAGGNYAAATEVVQTLTVYRSPQVITGFAVASPVTFGVTPITLSATAGASGDPVTFSILAGNNYATLSGSTLTITGAGTIVIAANEVGNANYQAAPQVTQTLVVNQAAQAINFGPLGTVEFGVAPIALIATDANTPNSGNPITFTLISGPGILTGNVLTVTGAGPIVIEADQAGNQNYSAAPPNQQTLTVNKTWQGLTFELPSPVTYSPNMAIALSATDVRTPNTGNPINFSVVSGPGTISHGVLTVTGAGSIVVQAEQDGDTNYWPAHANRTLLVNKAPQAIVFTLPVASPITYSAGQSYTLQAMDASINNSGNPFVFYVGAGPGFIPTGGNVLTPTGAGTITVVVSQAGNANYLDAPIVTQTLVVNSAGQAINFTAPASPIVFYGNHPNQTISLFATDVYPLHSDMPIVLSVSGPGNFGGNNSCSEPGCILTVTGAGSIVIAANQAAGPDQSGDPTGYLAAPTVFQTIVVTQAPQTIVNTTIAGPVTYGVGTITLSANDAAWNGSLLNHSANPIVFTVVSGPGTISGKTLTVTAAGQIILVANQAGDGNYLAATQISQTIIVNPATPTVKLTSGLNPVFVTNPVTLTAVVSAPAAGTPAPMLTPTGWVTFLNGTTPIGTSLLVPGTGLGTATLITSSLPFGTDAITATYTADANYTAASSTALSQLVGDFSITSPTAPQTVVPGALVVYTFTVAPLAPATTFPTAVTLTVAGLPVGATYTMTVGSTTTNIIAAGTSGSQTVTLSVQTPNTSIASNLQPQANTTLAQGGVNNSGSRLPAQKSPASKLPALAFALLLLPLAGRLRRTGKKLSRMLPLLLLLLAGIAAATGLSGCGGTPSGSFGQAPANYTIQVTGTSINLIHSTSVTLTIE